MNEKEAIDLLLRIARALHDRGYFIFALTPEELKGVDHLTMQPLVAKFAAKYIEEHTNVQGK